MVNAKEQNRVPSDRMIALEGEELRTLLASIANGRAYLAQALGDVTGTVMYAQRATKLLHENEYFERGLSNILSGFAYWSSGDLRAAHKAVTNAISNMRAAGRIPFIISFTSYLADIMTAQGRLHETERTYLQLLETITEQAESEVPERAVLYFGLSELYLEQGDLEAAKHYLQRGEKLGDQPAFPPWYRHWIWAHARVIRDQGDLDGVIEMLKGTERLYYRHPIPDVRPLTALLARAWLAQGKLAEAQHWSREQELSIDDDLSYLHEFEHITLARLLVAQYKSNGVDSYIQDAQGLLERLLKAAEEGGRMGSVTEILVLQALAYEAQDNLPSALLSLERALTLAEPEGYVRTFVGAGAPMKALLKRMEGDRERMKEYIHKLLAFFEEKEFQTSSFSAQPLMEPLSEREIEILQLIADGLTNQEIGSQLYLSLNTVKAHTRNIYGKLEVKSRTQAVAKARSLGILSAS
jgi:LuxR family maltose regulon positive regulatory protein